VFTYRSSQLDTSKAIGIDSIGSKVLKYCEKSLSRPLCQLLNLYHKSGKLIIISIHESNDCLLVNNYHPISLLSNTSKVLENWSSTTSVSICFDQSLLLNLRSTTQQLLSFLDNIKYLWSNLPWPWSNNFWKASTWFNIVKLRKAGICGNLRKWFKSYLTNHRHCVHITDTLLDTLPVLSGFWQGSIFGPFLFIFYINDLPATTSSSPIPDCWRY